MPVKVKRVYMYVRNYKPWEHSKEHARNAKENLEDQKFIICVTQDSFLTQYTLEQTRRGQKILDIGVLAVLKNSLTGIKHWTTALPVKHILQYQSKNKQNE